MRRLANLLLMVAVGVPTASIHAGRLPQEQNGGQSASPQQEQPQASSSAAAQTVTGCLVRTASGYALATETDTVPIETDKDLSQYVNKQIKVTGILEHHSAAAPATTNGPVTVTDLRLRVVASVVGDCNQAPK